MDRMPRSARGRVKRPAITDIELLDPAYKTGMLDGYARAIQEMGQHRRDRILERISTKSK